MNDKSINNENNILEIENFGFAFKNGKIFNEVIHNISFSIKKGEVLGLVGESGSGKSVTSLAIMNLFDKKKAKITSGNISFYGKRKAMIFQDPMTSLNPVKKCGYQVNEMIAINTNLSSKEIKKHTLKLFEKVLLPNVEKVYNSYPHQLSGGQLQRIMIAMALSSNPDLLIADEPTTALDVTVQKTILQLLKNIQKEYNMSILFISHDLDVVKHISDNIAVIYKGNIVEINKTKNIFNNPQHIYTKSLIASRPPINYKPKRLLTVEDFINNRNFENNVEPINNTKSYTNNDKILQIKNLEIYYKKYYAIKNISFDVYKGETLGIVGESGCGKTTIGRAITQLINIYSGNIIFEDTALNDMSKQQRHKLKKDIQIIFQDPYSSLNPTMTIGQAIKEPMDVYEIFKRNERKDKVIELLKQTGLGEEFYNKYPISLSGGQRQRVGIARALALQPKLIICDESVSALDVSVQAQVLNLLNDLKDKFDFTYIFISHDLSVVKYMSDRIMVMQNGNIIEQDSAEIIYNHPKKEYTKNLIDSSKLD